MLREDEQREQLHKGLTILQKKQGFRYGIDAVLLAHFVRSQGKLLELGSGTGIISLLLSQDAKNQITALEIQPALCEMFSRTLLENDITNVTVLEGDLMRLGELVVPGSFDVVVSNPPYYKHSIQSPDENKAVSRSEVLMDLDGFCRACGYALRERGSLYMIYHPSRLDELMENLLRYGLRTKVLRFVHPSAEKESNLVLVKAVKGAGQELRIQAPLFVYEQGSYHKDILKIYEEVAIERGER